MKERLIKILKSRITASVIFILLGACLAFMPVTTVYVIYKAVFGAVMIAVGIYQLYIYLYDGRDSTLLNMYAGSILLVLGGFLLFNPQIVVKLLPFLLGTFVLVDSVWSLQAAFRLKGKNLSAWIFVLAGSVVFVVLGILLMMNPFREVRTTAFYAGCVLLGNGVADVVYMLLIRYWRRTISPGYSEELQETEQEEESSLSAEGEDAVLSEGSDSEEELKMPESGENGSEEEAPVREEPQRLLIGSREEEPEGEAEDVPDLTLDADIFEREEDVHEEEILEEWKD